jgi:hypothetical protein
MGVRLVATDLDGTLLDPRGRVSARTAESVRAAREAGIHVVPVTGRPPQAIWPITEAAALGPLAVCSNGAALVDVERRHVLESEEIAGEIALGLVKTVREAIPGVRLASDNLDRFAFESGFFEVPAEWQEVLLEVPDISVAVARGCVKLIARHKDLSALELIAELEDRIAEEGHVTTSGLDWVDIGAPGVSKAYALERACQRMGVGVDEVVAIGDNHNDMSVLAWAGTAMAPANAIPDVLAMVDRVLPGNDVDGVAALLDELVAAAGAG